MITDAQRKHYATASAYLVSRRDKKEQVLATHGR
jgi:hypothetical protein